MGTVLVKRPVAFRIPRVVDDKLSETEWRYFTDEEAAYKEAEALGIDYQALFVRDGTVIVLDEREALEAAIDRMGWTEIHAFEAEMRKGQGIYEDAGGYIMRGLRRLFGMPEKQDEIVTYQKAARAMVASAMRQGDRP
jgi:hypothetical protein